MAETKLLSPERLKEITERVEKATAGPWKVRQYDGGHRGVDVAEPKDWQTTVFAPHVQYDGYGSGGASDANSAFIAASRTDIPDLLAERELLVGIVRKQQEALRDGYNLSTYAAAINWDGRRNLRPWMEGLHGKIEKAQESAAPLLSDPKISELLKEQG